MNRLGIDLPNDEHAVSRRDRWYELSSNTLHIDDMCVAVELAGYTVISYYINRFGCWIVRFKKEQ